jgi:hypothetical protein
MESLKIQIMDDAGQPAYEQRVFFKTDAEWILHQNRFPLVHVFVPK